MDIQSKYSELLEFIYDHYKPWLQEETPQTVQLVDPVDQKVIGFHYGETHMGSAFIIGGIHFSKPEITECGIRILNGFFRHADEFQKEPAYHWDFNNFALCVVYEYLEQKKTYPEIQDKIRSFILTQQDSKNVTINWLPMRLYVNKWRYQWTKGKKYKVTIDKVKKEIERAQYQDGFIEDLLPKGCSFNFQYHLFTTALLAFLKVRGVQIGKIDEAVKQAVDIMDYQGDINYLGRGCNQIFAWGPALYLYDLLENKTAYESGMAYVYEKSIQAITNDNLILNEFSGSEKIWWWDYHYCSVYIAHFVFWLMLSATENKKLHVIETAVHSVEDSGVHIHKGNYYILIFDGRKHYLAESGKIIANITKNETAYFKGAFGPYYKEYGYRYSSPWASFHNYIGLLLEKNKFGMLSQKIVYPERIDVLEISEEAHIVLSYKKTVKNAIVNLPWFISNILPIVIKDGSGNVINIRLAATFKGPYGWIYLYQSKQITTDKIEIVIGENHG